MLSQQELEHTAISFKKAAGFDVETVNSRESFVERPCQPAMNANIPRRRFLQLASAAAALPALPRLAQAQSFPSRFVRLIVPFPPGGGGDALARPLAQRLSEVWGQQVIVENRGGAGGNVGAYQAANAPADGYTLAARRGVSVHQPDALSGVGLQSVHRSRAGVAAHASSPTR